MSEADRNYEFNIEHGLAVVGSPETVIRRLQAGQQHMGYDLFCTNHQVGRMPPELVNRSIELFDHAPNVSFEFCGCCDQQGIGVLVGDDKHLSDHTGDRGLSSRSADATSSTSATSATAAPAP